MVSEAGQVEGEEEELGSGCYFGEVSLVGGGPRAATVTARGSLVCARLDKARYSYSYFSKQHCISKTLSFLDVLASQGVALSLTHVMKLGSKFLSFSL